MATQSKAGKELSAASKKANETLKENLMEGETMMKENWEKTKEGFERASEAFGKAKAFNKTGLDAMTASATVAGKGIESLSSSNFSYAKESFEKALGAFQSIVSAKDPKEAMELQADFARQSMDRYLKQVNESAEAVSKTYKDALQPLSAHWKQSLETFQN